MPYQTILEFHAVVIKGFDEKQSDKGTEYGQTYMSVRYLVLPIERSRTAANPEWTSISFRTVRATKGCVAISIITFQRLGRNLPSTIGGKAFLCCPSADIALAGSTGLTPCSDKGTYFSNGGCSTVELTSYCCWTTFSCQQTKVVPRTKLSKGQEDAVYYLGIFISTVMISEDNSL